MEILLVCAVPLEAQVLRSRPSNLMRAGEEEHFVAGPYKVRLLCTGIGMVNAARSVSLALARRKPDMAVQFGVAGAFDPARALTSMVQVRQDIFAELGADSPEGFLPLEKLGFPAFRLQDKDVFNTLDNPHPPLDALPEAKGITVNTVSGRAEAIAAMRLRWSPDVETMEGAAFFQCCLMADVPFHQVRAISNTVENRNRTAWRMKDASDKMQEWIWKELLG